MIKIGVVGGGLRTLSPEVIRMILETSKKYSVNLCSIGQNIQDNGIISLGDVVNPHPLNQLTTLPCNNDNRVSRGKGARKSRKKKRGW